MLHRKNLLPKTDDLAVIAKLMEYEAQLNDALDALESMVEQYLGTDDGLDHMFMSAGEEACDLLAVLRPERWELTPIGLRRKATP